MHWKNFILLFLSIHFFGCAGPTGPFGPYDIFDANIYKENRIHENFSFVESKDLTLQSNNAVIDFMPKKQNLHMTKNFSIVINDQYPINKNSSFKLFYNAIDVTTSWLKNSKFKYSEDRTKLRITFSRLKLPVSMNHNIVFTYRPNLLTQIKVSKYLGPTCSISSLEQLGQIEGFEELKTGLSKKIETISIEEGINPSFIAGLIAQESGFDSSAVSIAKAIGLTQITEVAEQQILDENKQWPRYRGLSSLPVPIIKSYILMGKVNEKNEWRLNPEKSIKGGIKYLKYLEEYWLNNRESHMTLLNVYDNEAEVLDDLILASYNSGPYRVKKSLKRNGKNWLNGQSLKEAKKYVRKVRSYCYHFSDSHQ